MSCTGLVTSAVSGALVAVRLEHGGDRRVAARELKRMRGQLRQHPLVPFPGLAQRLPANDLTAPHQGLQ